MINLSIKIDYELIYSKIELMRRVQYPDMTEGNACILRRKKSVKFCKT